jgi:hypothetical protein
MSDKDIAPIGLVDLQDFVIDNVLPAVIFEVPRHLILLGCLRKS